MSASASSSDGMLVDKKTTSSTARKSTSKLPGRTKSDDGRKSSECLTVAFCGRLMAQVGRFGLWLISRLSRSDDSTINITVIITWAKVILQKATLLGSCRYLLLCHSMLGPSLCGKGWS